jgi:hypothetical protein
MQNNSAENNFVTIWCHLYFNTENHNSRTNGKNILRWTKYEFVGNFTSSLLGKYLGVINLV